MFTCAVQLGSWKLWRMDSWRYTFPLRSFALSGLDPQVLDVGSVNPEESSLVIAELVTLLEVLGPSAPLPPR